MQLPPPLLPRRSIRFGGRRSLLRRFQAWLRREPGLWHGVVGGCAVLALAVAGGQVLAQQSNVGPVPVDPSAGAGRAGCARRAARPAGRRTCRKPAPA
jgi:hypothetical protein